MSPRAAHPPLEEWSVWLRGTLAADAAARLRRHLASCPACVADVDLLRQLRALSTDPWGRIPERARRRARMMPQAPPAPPRPARVRSLRLCPPDVRTVAGVPVSPRAARVLARSVPGADVSVMATPPHGEGLWRIQGRIWLRPPDPRPPRIVLLQQDHVLADTPADPRGRFRLDEALAPGFRLEIHLPSGGVVQLEDRPW